MKKRRELDALVGNGKMSRGRNVKKTQELLLENMSDSSDVEEFTLQGPMGKQVVRKTGFMHFCKSCLTVCSFFMLIMCVIAVGCLILVYNDLKSEREKDQKTINNLKNNIEDMSKFTTDIESINKSITDLMGELASLKSEVKTNDENAPNVNDLKETVNKLKQKVAQFGSNIETLKSQVNDAQKPSQTVIDDMASHKAELDQLKNRTKTLENRLDLLELKANSHATTTDTSTDDMHEIVQQAVSSVTEDLRNYTNFEIDSKLNVLDGRIALLESDITSMKSSTNPHQGSYPEITDFISTTTNKFVFINHSIYGINQDLLSLHESINSQNSRITPLEEFKNDYQAQTNNNKTPTEIDKNTESKTDSKSNSDTDALNKVDVNDSGEKTSVDEVLKGTTKSDVMQSSTVTSGDRNGEVDTNVNGQDETGNAKVSPLVLLTTVSTLKSVNDGVQSHDFTTSAAQEEQDNNSNIEQIDNVTSNDETNNDIKLQTTASSSTTTVVKEDVFSDASEGSEHSGRRT